MRQAPVVLSVCEHSAAKSIVAAVYFNKIARETGLSARAMARGTHPGLASSEYAVMGLPADNLRPTEPGAQKSEPADIAGARRVISFCVLPQEHEREPRIELWDNAPPTSEDFAAARDVILGHIQQLVMSL